MNEMFRSAVFKLTAAYLAIVMSISIIFSAFLYNLAVQQLQVGFHNQYMRWFTEYQPFGLRKPTEPTGELAARSKHIYNQLVYLNIMVFAVTGVASYILARRTLRPIERVHEQQKRFTADVSHELRTPLTSIRMETEVALMDPTIHSDELRQTLESNLEEAKRMEGLVNSLLQIASLEANQLRTEFSDIELKKILEAAIQVVRPYAEMKHISINSRLARATVRGSQPSLTQLCIILLENAVKYSPENSQISVTIQNINQEAIIEIKDQGPGIPPEALPHIFDRFYRADTSRNEQGPRGFGLGLSLAKLIADIHNGEITLTSNPGKGTVARLLLSSRH